MSAASSSIETEAPPHGLLHKHCYIYVRPKANCVHAKAKAKVKTKAKAKVSVKSKTERRSYIKWTPLHNGSDVASDSGAEPDDEQHEDAWAEGDWGKGNAWAEGADDDCWAENYWGEGDAWDEDCEKDDDWSKDEGEEDFAEGLQ